MRKVRLLLICIFLPIFSLCQENIEWITHFGSATPYYGSEYGQNIVADKEGNVYVSGEFSKSFIIDNRELVSNGGDDVFLAKLNPSGKVLWIKKFGGVDYDWCGGICIDENSNIFLTGTFRKQITLGDSVFISSKNGYDFFLTKIDENGIVIWSRAFIGEGDNSTTTITNDNNGYIFLSGYYNNTLKFDNYQLNGPHARSDLFVTKLNTNGQVIWANSTRSNANNFGNSIASDKDGHLYLTGFMWDSVYFDNHLLISTNSLGLDQAFVSKIDATTGEFLWAIGGGGDGWSEGSTVAVDNNGDVVISGWYRNDVFFNDDSLTNGGNDNGPDDIFIAKFNSQGSLKWLKTTRCNLYSGSNGLTINSNNDIFLTGYYRGLIRVGVSNYQSTVSSYYDIFALKLNQDGQFKWFKSFGGDSPMNDIGYGITHYNNSIFITGMYSSNSWFDNIFLNCNGASDIFILKLSNTSGILENEIENIDIYPNPCSNAIFVNFKNKDASFCQIRLFDIVGREIFVKSFLNSQSFEIDMTNFSRGIYFLHFQDLNNNKSITKKIIKNN